MEQNIETQQITDLYNKIIKNGKSFENNSTNVPLNTDTVVINADILVLENDNILINANNVILNAKTICFTNFAFLQSSKPIIISKILIIYDILELWLQFYSKLFAKNLNATLLALSSISYLDIYSEYDLIILQNTFFEITKQKTQKIIYIVYFSCDTLNDIQINMLKQNRKFIDKYIFTSNYIKTSFEKHIFMPQNSLIQELQLGNIIDKEQVQEQKKLFVSYGIYDIHSNYEILIEKFKIFDTKYILEIYGYIDNINIEYYKKLEKYIADNKIENIKLNILQETNINRITYAEYYIDLQNDNYFWLYYAIAMNKKIIYLPNSNLEPIPEQLYWYPNKINFNINIYDWFSFDTIKYLGYVNNYQCLKTLIENNKRNKIGNINCCSTDILFADTIKHNNNKQNGYSFLIITQNDEGTIKKCILDIVDLADEIIIIDKYSSDNTKTIIQELEQLYSNIFVYEYTIKNSTEHLLNWTLSKARFNKTILWSPNLYCIKTQCKEMLETFRNNNSFYTVIFSGIQLLTSNNNIYIKDTLKFDENKIYIYNNFTQSMTQDKYIWYKPVFFSLIHNKKNTKNIQQIYEPFTIPNIYISTNCSNCSNNDSNNGNDETMNKTFDIFDDKKKSIIYKKKKSILLIFDSLGWAFDNITQNIIKYNTLYNIKRITYPELLNKLTNNLNIPLWRQQYEYCDINLESFNYCVFFWYGYDVLKILELLKQKKNIQTIILAIYDYSKWINNNNKEEEIILKKYLETFFSHIKYYFYGSKIIKNYIEQQDFFTNQIAYPAYDGVDSLLFNKHEYNDILTKKKLIIGWIGNSNPLLHGINKGITIIKHLMNKLDDKFIFMTQDSYVNKLISHNDVANYFTYIDIVICFSNYEGTPNQILEASSCGKCWISTKVGIVEDLYNTLLTDLTSNNTSNNTLLSDKQPGILIERTIEDLEQKLLFLYNNREQIINYGNNGRLAIEKEWKWNIKVQQFYDLFDKI